MAARRGGEDCMLDQCDLQCRMKNDTPISVFGISLDCLKLLMLCVVQSSEVEVEVVYLLAVPRSSKSDAEDSVIASR